MVMVRDMADTQVGEEGFWSKLLGCMLRACLVFFLRVLVFEGGPRSMLCGSTSRPVLLLFFPGITEGRHSLALHLQKLLLGERTGELPGPTRVHPACCTTCETNICRTSIRRSFDSYHDPPRRVSPLLKVATNMGDLV